jgi:hypothetical protein
MAANTSPIFELVVTDACKTIVNADSTNKVTIQTAGADGARIDSLMISSDDTSAVNLAFYITISAVDYYIGNVLVPIGSGYTTVARVEGLTTLAPILGYLALAPNAILKANAVVAVTAAKVVTIVAMGGDY